MKIHRWSRAVDGESSRSVQDEVLCAALQEDGFAVERFTQPIGAFEPNPEHREDTVLAVVSGKLCILAGEGGAVLEAGDLVVLEAGEEHSVEVLEPVEVWTGVRDVDPDVSTPEPFLVRLTVFAILMFAAHTWLVAHLGVDPLAVLVFDVALVAVTQVRSYLRTREQESIQKSFRQGLFFLLQTDVLVTLAFLILTITSVVSTVAVQAVGTSHTTQVRLASSEGVGLSTWSLAQWLWREDDADALAPTETLRYVTWTTLLGRTLRLQVDGYLDGVVSVWPWRVTRVVVPRDLRPVPMVLIRIDHTARRDGDLRLRLDDASEFAKFKIDQGKEGDFDGPRQLAGFLGSDHEIPTHLLERWRLQLELGLAEVSTDSSDPTDPADHNDANRDAADRDATFLSWQKPVRVRPYEVNPEFSLTPGQHIVASLYKREETEPTFQKCFEVTSEPIQDHLLRESDKSPSCT